MNRPAWIGVQGDRLVNGAGETVRLAGDFAFGRCVRRTGLADVLRDRLAS